MWFRKTPSTPTDVSDAAAAASGAIRQLIQVFVQQSLNGEDSTRQEVCQPLPFTRAETADYLKLIELWNQSGRDRVRGQAPRSCPACSADSHQFLFESYDQYPFHACRQCGMWFVPCQVDQPLYKSFFAEHPPAKTIAEKMMHGRNRRTRDSDHERFSGYLGLLKSHLSSLGDVRPRYLDIGCGVGHSVEVADGAGLDATGLEVNRVALQVARENNRNVFHPDEWLTSEQFDVISLFETLEHVTDTEAMLSRVVSHLKPSGLLMVTVPNRASWEISLLRERSFHVYGGVEGTGHINLFDSSTLKRLFQRHGLAMVHTDGQFGNNSPLLYDSLTSSSRSALEMFGAGQVSCFLPEPVCDCLNSIGPALTVLDRMTGRSPILIAVACHQSSQANLSRTIAEMEERRRQELLTAAEAA